MSLGDAQQETSLGVGLLEKIVTGKKEYFQRRNSALQLRLRRRDTATALEIDSTCSVTRDSFLSVAEEAYRPPPPLFFHYDQPHLHLSHNK